MPKADILDPDGREIISAIIIGAMIGSFVGAVAAGYSGAAVGDIMIGFGAGAIAGGAGGLVGGSGIAFSKTLATVTSSTMNSAGNAAFTGGDVSTHFGAFSVNWSQGDFNSFSGDNSFMENLGYGLGAFTNISDAYSFLSGVNSTNSSTIELQSDNHSSLQTISGINNNSEVGRRGQCILVGEKSR